MAAKISTEIYENRLRNESKKIQLLPKLTNSVKLNSSVTQKKMLELNAVN